MSRRCVDCCKVKDNSPIHVVHWETLFCGCCFGTLYKFCVTFVALKCSLLFGVTIFFKETHTVVYEMNKKDSGDIIKL